MTESRRTICLNCAWRHDCKRRFSEHSSNAIRLCPDYTRDVTLPIDSSEATEDETPQARKRIIDLDRDFDPTNRVKLEKESED